MFERELESLLLFVKVMELGSFSAAARELGVRPSSVSRRISALEDLLEVRLLNRSTRHLQLTEAGEVYLDYAMNISSQAEEAKLAVAQLRAEPSGTLRVTAPVTLAKRRLTPLIPEFLQRYPKVQLGLHLDDRFIDFVKEGYDVAVRIGYAGGQNLVTRRIATSGAVVCCSPSYFREYGVPKHPSELTLHNCLTFNTQLSKSRWSFTDGSTTLDVQVSGSFFANNTEALLEALLQGLGIGMMPSWLVQKELETGKLLQVLDEYEPSPSSVPILAVFPHRRHIAPKVRAYIDFLVETFADF